MEALFDLVQNDIGLFAGPSLWLKIILFRLILILRAVFRGGHACIFLKNIAEIVGIVIARLIGDPGAFFVRRAQKLFGPHEPQVNKILCKSLPRVLGKNSGESALAHAHGSGDVLKHEVGIPELL